MRKPLDLTIEFVEPKPVTFTSPITGKTRQVERTFPGLAIDFAGAICPEIAALVEAVRDTPFALAQARRALGEDLDSAEAAKQQRIAELKRELALLEGVA
ncbi:hypothetical protein LLG46_02230 [bacterium]|nr:hypothetical protein [bacterium]